MLKDEIKKKKSIRKLKKPESTELTRQTRDSGHETGMSSWNVYLKKLWSSVPNKSNVEWWNWN
jgi:hypothetical protein